KRISRRQDDSLEWRIGPSSINLYGIPKATLTEFRDCLAEQIGHVVAENMKDSGLETSLKPIRFALSHDLFVYILPDSYKNTVELLVGSSGISIAKVKLKTNKQKKIQAFFNNLNNI